MKEEQGCYHTQPDCSLLCVGRSVFLNNTIPFHLSKIPTLIISLTKSSLRLLLLLSCYSQGIDEAYDQALHEYFYPYHSLVDLLVRVAVNQENVTETVINLHAMVAYEGAALHMPFFAKLW